MAWGKGWYAGIPRKEEDCYVEKMMMFSRDKCHVLYLGRKSSWQEHKLRTEGLGGSSPAGKALRLSAHSKLPDKEGRWATASWAVSPGTWPVDQGTRLSSLIIQHPLHYTELYCIQFWVPDKGKLLINWNGFSKTIMVGTCPSRWVSWNWPFSVWRRGGLLVPLGVIDQKMELDSGQWLNCNRSGSD